MRYYYKNEKGNYFSYLSEHEGLIPITKEEYEEKVNARRLKFTKPDETTIALKNELFECHSKLKEMDYIGVKIATGRATKEEYAEEIAEMTRLANRINEIEDILGGKHNAAV